MSIMLVGGSVHWTMELSYGLAVHRNDRSNRGAPLQLWEHRTATLSKCVRSEYSTYRKLSLCQVAKSVWPLTTCRNAGPMSNAHDLDRIMALFSDDCVLMPSGAAPTEPFLGVRALSKRSAGLY